MANVNETSPAEKNGSGNRATIGRETGKTGKRNCNYWPDRLTFPYLERASACHIQNGPPANERDYEYRYFKSFEYYEALLRIHVKDSFIKYMHLLKEKESPLLSNREDPFLMFSVQKDIMNELFPKVELILSMKKEK